MRIQLPAPALHPALPAAPIHPAITGPRYRARMITGAVLAALTVPVLLPGLIDPVEGSLPVLAGGALLLAAWLFARVPVPRLAWIAWTVTAVCGGATLAIVGFWPDLVQGPVNGPLALPLPILIPLAVYEIGVLVTIAGAAWNAVRVIRAAAR